MKKLGILLFCLLFTLPAMGAMPFIYINTAGGQLGGGLGFDLGGNRAVDLSFAGAAGKSGSTYSIYGDYYVGCWGVGVTAKKNTVDSPISYNLTLQYALEQAVNDKISIGACFTLADYDTADAADPNLSLLKSVGPYFKLAF
jgi:hypothetical protein